MIKRDWNKNIDLNTFGDFRKYELGRKNSSENKEIYPNQEREEKR